MLSRDLVSSRVCSLPRDLHFLPQAVHREQQSLGLFDVGKPLTYGDLVTTFTSSK